ncbi:MAG: cytochrome C oxidase subunit IV family protein [Chloroflexota bacterium]
MEQDKKLHEHMHGLSTGYGLNILVWLSLLSLTALTVAVAGINLGGYTLVVALGIAAIKSALVINIFMHIKYDDPIFKFFIAMVIAVLIVIFVLTAYDVFYRVRV